MPMDTGKWITISRKPTIKRVFTFTIFTHEIIQKLSNDMTYSKKKYIYLNFIHELRITKF